MVILPTVIHSRAKNNNKITFFKKTISFLQQQAEQSEQQAKQEHQEEEEARKVWQQQEEAHQRVQEATTRLQTVARQLMAMENSIPKKGIKLVPCLPLVDKEVVDVDKTVLLNFKLKIRPNGSNDNTYEKSIRRFSDGSPTIWIQTLQDIQEVWQQNKIAGPQDRAALVKTILRDDALTVFLASLEGQTDAEGVEGTVGTPMTTEMVEVALNAVTASVFPHRALETQKLWMRRHMKKPAGMSYRLLQAKVMKMNKSLPLFPEGTMEAKFNNAELLELLEFALPATWRAKFDLDGYVPTKHDRARLLKECEAIERNEKLDSSLNNQKQMPKKKEMDKKPAVVRKMSNNPKLKYCTEHGPNVTHDSSKCWVIHPELKPSKFDKSEKFAGQGKAMKALLKNTSKSELFNMFLSSQKETTKTKVTTSGTKGTKKRTKKEQRFPESSDESVQHMECETPAASDTEATPPPSDDEIMTKPLKKQKRVRQLGQAEK